MTDWQRIVELLRERGVELAGSSSPRSVGGGDIDAAWRVDSSAGPVFLKTCRAADYERLAGEAEGLEELAGTAAIRVPRVLACVRSDTTGCLALEWLAFERPDRSVEERLGTALAELHRHTRERFGWHRDNTIGLTPQINTQDGDWSRFFRTHRLEYQLALAARRGFDGELQEAGARLVAGLDRLLENHEPAASLLHGDLWGGNWAAVDGRPVIFDPAVYYGDRETDLAMTRLFGGFGRAFYRAYDEAWPLPEGHEQRQLLYQLYHVLNHLNLFGGAYLGRALDIMRRLNRH